MKKNRLFAGILCILIFMTAIPILQVSAQTTVTKTLEEIVGSGIMEMEHYDFSTDTYTGINHNMVVKVSFDAENGLVLPVGESAYFRYIPELYWSPISNGKFLVFKAKVANETAAFAPLWQGPTTQKKPLRASIAITASGVNGGEGGYTYRNSSYKPGTDWVEYLLTADTVDTWSVYGKKPEESAWTLLISGGYGTNGSDSTGFYFSGAGYVKEASLHTKEENFATQYSFKMGDDFDANTPGVTAPDAVTYSDENGADMTCTGYWKFLKQNGWTPFEGENMVSFSAKVVGSSGVINLQLPSTDTTLPRRAYVDIHPTGIVVMGSESHTGWGAATNQFSFKPGDEWVDYLVDANADETYSFYVKVDGNWKLLAKTEGFTDSNSAETLGVQFYFGGDGGYIKNLKVFNPYGVGEENTKPEETQAYYFEDFNGMPKYSNILLSGSATVQESNLVLTEGGSLELEDAIIPLGGYAEFRVKSNASNTELNFGDESGALKLELDGGESRVNGTAIPVADGGDSYRLWRLVRNQDGGYSGFCQTEGEKSWYPAFQNVSSLSTGLATTLTIRQYEHSKDGAVGQSFFDYIKISGSATGSEVVLNDGGGTTRVPETGKLKKPESLCAVVTASETTDRKIIFAEYDGSYIMRKAEIFDIPGNGRDAMVTHCIKSEDVEIRQVRIFLWDDFNGLKPMEAVLTTKGDISFWGDDWMVEGTNEMTDGVITLKPGTAQESSAKINPEIGSQFDISWEMAVEKPGESTSVQLASNSYVTTLTFAQDNISFPTTSGTKSVPYPLDNQNHWYRIVGNGGNWDLHIDGSLFCDMDGMVADDSGSRLLFANRNGAVMMISGLQVSRYQITDNPTTTSGFDNGDTCGFTLDAPLYEDSETGFWSCADGYLIGNDPSVTPSQPSTQIDVAIQEDYIFESRIQFKGLGNWASMLIYNKGYYMLMEIHGKYLNVHSPKSQSGEEISVSDYFELDPEKWYNLKVTSHSSGKYARVYLDGQLVTEEELYPTAFTGGRIVFRTYGAWTEACHYKIDWIKFVPLAKQSIGTITMPETEDVSAFLYAEVSESKTLSALLTSMNNFDEVDTVTYRLNGKEIGKTDTYPYQVTASNLTVGNHMLEAVCRDQNGFELARITEQVLLDGEGSTHYSNELSYTVSGSGTVDLRNGNHQLKMTHSGTSVTCTTDTGSETFPYGNGRFHVITDGAIAEVYWNGQFSFSFYMPMTSEVGTAFTGNISETAVSVPSERKNYFAAKDISGLKQIYELADLSYNHNLDFVAGAGDSAHLALNDGYFRTDVTIENGSVYVWDGAVTNSVPEKTKVDTIGNTDAYYRIETSGGMSRLYKNGRWISTFRGGRATGPATLSVNVTAGSLSYLSVNDNADLYLYQDDFSGIGEVDATDFWSVYGLDMSVSNGNLVLNATGKTNAIAELNVPAGDFDLSAKVNISSLGTSGGFWYLLNHSGTESYTKAGYSKEVSGYQIIDRENAKTLSQSSTKRASLSTNQTVQLDLKVRQVSDGEKITLLVNGTEVLSRVESSERRGKVGFILSNCTASIEEFSYRGDGKPVLGTRRSVLANKGHSDMIETDRGEIYKVNSGGGFKTSDGGLTWTEVTPTAGAGYSSDRHGGWNSNMLQLDDGKVLSMVLFASKGEYGKNKYYYRVYKSLDYGFSWIKNQKAILQPDNEPLYGIGATVNAFTKGKSGRIYFCHHNGNSEDIGDTVIWYSDNEGETWTQSVVIDGREQGHVLAESVVIENDAGTRVYFRNEKGYLCYYTSPDRGNTWDLEHLYKTPFIAPTACYGIEMDPNDCNTVYVGWLYDNMNLFGKHQWPRTRLAVAKSTDGGISWEYLGTANENNIIPYTNSNITINVSKDYLIVGNDLCDDTSGSMTWHNGFSVIPKDLQKTSKRFEQLHSQFPSQIENTKVIPDHRMAGTLAMNSATGEVLLRGERIVGGADGEYLAQAVAEKYLGKAVSLSNSNTKTVNGKTFIKVSDFVQEYNLAMVEEGDVWIVSENADWSVRQKKAFRYALDLFHAEP